MRGDIDATTCRCLSWLRCSLQVSCTSRVNRYLLHGEGSPLSVVKGLPPRSEVDTASLREAPAYERASYLSHLVVCCVELCKER